MQIVFGWGYDGARWSDRDSLRRYVTGPTGFTSLIATRLGLTTPDISHVQRIAAYRRVLERHVADAAQAPWFAESFAKDPWATARQVLLWRDELIGAGWKADGDASATMPPRLRTLARIETILSDEPSWSAGSADVLRDVAAELEWLVSSKMPYSLGIEKVTLEHAQSELPQIWHHVFDHMAALGVDVVEASQVAPLSDLRILHTDSEWDAAAMATRAVQAHANAPFGSRTMHPTSCGCATPVRRILPHNVFIR